MQRFQPLWPAAVVGPACALALALAAPAPATGQRPAPAAGGRDSADTSAVGPRAQPAERRSAWVGYALGGHGDLLGLAATLGVEIGRDQVASIRFATAESFCIFACDPQRFSEFGLLYGLLVGESSHLRLVASAGIGVASGSMDTGERSTRTRFTTLAVPLEAQFQLRVIGPVGLGLITATNLNREVAVTSVYVGLMLGAWPRGAATGP